MTDTKAIKNTINKLDSLDIRYIKSTIIDKMELTYLSKGKNATVYKSNYDNKDVTVKIMDLFLDSPLIKIFDNNMIISQTGINDIIISDILQKYNHITIQRFYGYTITQKSIIMIKQFCDYDMLTFIDKINDNDIISNVLLHIILAIRLMFQINTKGYFRDVKLRNILVVKDENVKDITYKLGDNVITLKTFGYYPVLTDFGSSVIINDKIIMRHMDWKMSADGNTGIGKYIEMVDNLYKFTKSSKDIILDESFDIYLLYRDCKKNPKLINNWIIKEYETLLKKKKINKSIDYLPNCVTIEDFLTSNNIIKYIKSL